MTHLQLKAIDYFGEQNEDASGSPGGRGLFTDSQLAELAEIPPLTRRQLLAINHYGNQPNWGRSIQPPLTARQLEAIDYYAYEADEGDDGVDAPIEDVSYQGQGGMVREPGRLAVAVPGDTPLPGLTGSLRHLKHLTSLIELDLFGSSNVTGNLRSLKPLVNLEKLNLFFCWRVTGDLSSLSKLRCETSSWAHHRHRHHHRHH